MNAKISFDYNDYDKERGPEAGGVRGKGFPNTLTTRERP